MFLVLKKIYCKSTVQLCDSLLNTKCKLNKVKLLNEFLINCLNKFIIPKWLIKRIYKSKIKYSQKAEIFFIKSEIAKNNEYTIKLEIGIKNCMMKLRNLLSSDHFDQLVRYIDTIKDKQKEKIELKNDSNIKRLLNLKYGTCLKQNVTNLSKYNFEEKEINALSYGLNFCIPPKNNNRELTYLGFENFLKQINTLKPIKPGNEMSFKANLVAIAHNYANTKPEKNFMLDTNEMSDVIKSIKKNDKIVLAKPDKGSGIVVLDKTEYLRKMMEILDDKTKFVKMGPASNFDNIVKIEKEIINTLKDLVCKKEISQETFNDIKPIGSIRPRLYGLPKMHKKGVPMRPILSMTKSPQHNLARFLNVLLEPVLNHFSRFVVKDSFEVIERIRNTDSENTFLSSFDVKKLFTNVPLDEIIQICCEVLYSIRQLSIKKESFRKLMKVATSGVQFSFNNEIYTQIDGVSMGSPLGPTLANIFMGYLESKMVDELTSQTLYIRYMDDCLVISQSEKANENLFRKLNALHEKNSFTKEMDINSQIPFLDILI